MGLDDEHLNSFTDDDLTQLVEQAAESMGLPRDADYSAYSAQLVQVASAFEEEIEGSILEFDPEGRALDEDDWALDVYHTLSGAGVGIWDGRWDHIYSESELKELQKFLKHELRGWVDDTGGGKFNETLMDEATDIAEDYEDEDDGEDDE